MEEERETSVSLFKAIELNMRMYEASDLGRCAPRNARYLIFRHGQNSTNEATSSCREISTLTQVKEKLSPGFSLWEANYTVKYELI